MLVLAPAACIMSGIALSESFDVFTRSIKFQFHSLSGTPQANVRKVIYAISDYYFRSLDKEIKMLMLSLRQGIVVMPMLPKLSLRKVKIPRRSDLRENQRRRKRRT